jgi:hypothetical protein
MKQYIMRREILQENPMYNFLYILCGSLGWRDVDIMFQPESIEQATYRATRDIELLKVELQNKFISAPNMIARMDDISKRLGLIRTITARFFTKDMPSYESKLNIFADILEKYMLNTMIVYRWLCRIRAKEWVVTFNSNKIIDIPQYERLNKILELFRIKPITIERLDVSDESRTYRKMQEEFKYAIIVIVVVLFFHLNRKVLVDQAYKPKAGGVFETNVDMIKWMFTDKQGDEYYMRMLLDRTALVRQKLRFEEDYWTSVPEMLSLLFSPFNPNDEGEPAEIEKLKEQIRIHALKLIEENNDKYGITLAMIHEAFDEEVAWDKTMSDLFTQVSDTPDTSFRPKPYRNISEVNDETQLKLIQKWNANTMQNDKELTRNTRLESASQIAATLPFSKLGPSDLKKEYSNSWKRLSDSYVLVFDPEANFQEMIDPSEDRLYSIVTASTTVSEAYEVIRERFQLDKLESGRFWSTIYSPSIKKYLRGLYTSIPTFDLFRDAPELIDPRLHIVFKLFQLEVIRYFLKILSEEKLRKMDKSKGELEDAYRDLLKGEDFSAQRQQIVDGKFYERALSHIVGRPENLGSLTISPPIFSAMRKAWNDLCKKRPKFKKLDLEVFLDLAREYGIIDDFAEYTKSKINFAEITRPKEWKGKDNPTNVRDEFVNAASSLLSWDVFEESGKIIFKQK